MSNNSVYVALLRGINVGGNNKIEMKKLKTTFEGLGFSDVKTYINTGNIIFADTRFSPDELAKTIETAIEADFKLKIKVLIRSYHQIKKTAQAIPNSWVNDKQMKCDVMFLWESIDTKSIVKDLPIRAELDDVIYTPGAIIWRVSRANVTRSGLLKLVGTKLYAQMTIRNCNTVRKLFTLMETV